MCGILLIIYVDENDQKCLFLILNITSFVVLDQNGFIFKKREFVTLNIMGLNSESGILMCRGGGWLIKPARM